MVANVIGSVALASLLTDGTLTALYLAVVLQAAVLVLRGVFAALARTNALSALRMISRHGPLVQQRLDRGLIWLAAIGWVLGTLAGFSVIRPFFQYARIVLAKPLEVGHLSVSLGDILGFVLVIWLSILVSRFLRFFLEEEVFVRVRLARGVPGTVSRLTHYSVIALGFMVALSASGFGLDRLTVLAGAFGVGVGFGLQDVVKNFVSGLILLFERPIKIGDQIEFGGMSGEVTGIGIRASTLRNYEGADVIVPNGTLLAGQLTNWTYASAPRRMEITVGVAYGTEPKQVLELLLRVASEHADICKTPAPMALFVGFGDSALNFSLRAWTARTDRYLGIKSELTAAVNATLNQAGIEMPFPQRDLHLRSVDPAVRKLL
jgi:small-conductance mechanosensitive channel